MSHLKYRQVGWRASRLTTRDLILDDIIEISVELLSLSRSPPTAQAYVNGESTLIWVSLLKSTDVLELLKVSFFPLGSIPKFA